MIGIEFKRENKYGNFLKHLLNNIAFDKYSFFCPEQEMYYIEQFDNLIYGKDLKDILDKNYDYYIIFLNMQVYPKNKKVENIYNYSDFLKSDCDLIILISDVINVEIYFKDEKLKEHILKNLQDMDVKYNLKTLGNDARYIMHVN